MKRVIISLVICLALLTMALPAYADTTYVVKPGDSLSKIATQFGVSVQAVVAANGLANPNLIWVGQRLIIPAPGTVPAAPVKASAPAGGVTSQTTYRVQSGDTLFKISRQFGVSLTALMAANGLSSYVIFTGQVLTIPAVGAAAPAAVPTAPPAITAPTVASGAAPGPINNVFRGLHGTAFSIENRSVHAGDEIWFDFTVSNESNSGEGYAVLSIHSDYGISGQSWTNRTFLPWTTLSWRDHIHVDKPGLYPFYLGICYGSVAECMNNQSPWQRLSPNITVGVDTPLPTSGYSSRGVQGDYFYVEDMTPSTQNQIWFDFGATNTNNGDVPFGALSVVVAQTTSGSSWTESKLKASQVLSWRDHISNLNPGVYAFYLGICYADKNECAQNLALWDRLSDNVYVTVTQP